MSIEEELILITLKILSYLVIIIIDLLLIKNVFYYNLLIMSENYLNWLINMIGNVIKYNLSKRNTFKPYIKQIFRFQT